MRSTLRTVRWAAVATLAGLALMGGVRAEAATGDQPTLSARTVGTFTFHPCAPGPASDFCLTDDVTGTLGPAGPVTGVFEVRIEFSQTTADGCAAVDKRGSFRTADGSTLKLVAHGFFCNDTGIVAYDYLVTGATGRLADAEGTGQWVVPPPTTSSATGGVGFEYFFGRLAVRES